jgi:rubrerythrin
VAQWLLNKHKEDDMSKTVKNLEEAFAGESQANRKYLAFAKKAEEEGYKQVAKLFKAAAEAETVHAHNHLRELNGVKSTKENLETAIGGETHEFQNMYPNMIKEAGKEGNDSAKRSFDMANEVEKIHATLYEKAHKYLGNEEEVDYYVCEICGNTVENEAPDNCPICGAKKEMFKKMD